MAEPERLAGKWIGQFMTGLFFILLVLFLIGTAFRYCGGDLS